MSTGRIKSGPAALMPQKMQENRPCDGCGLFNKCGEELLSCSDFNAWVGDGGVRPASGKRKPSRGLYYRIFPNSRSKNQEAA
jgi:hypothetical protein